MLSRGEIIVCSWSPGCVPANTAQDTFDFSAARCHCWLKLGSLRTKNPSDSSTELSPGQACSSLCHCQRPFLPTYTTWLLSYWILWASCQTISPASLPPSEWQPCPAVHQLSPCYLISSLNLRREHSISSSKSWIKISNKTTPSIYHCELHFFFTSLLREYNPLTSRVYWNYFF